MRALAQSRLILDWPPNMRTGDVQLSRAMAGHEFLLLKSGPGKTLARSDTQGACLPVCIFRQGLSVLQVPKRSLLLAMICWSTLRCPPSSTIVQHPWYQATTLEAFQAALGGTGESSAHAPRHTLSLSSPCSQTWQHGVMCLCQALQVLLADGHQLHSLHFLEERCRC